MASPSPWIGAGAAALSLGLAPTMAEAAIAGSDIANTAQIDAIIGGTPLRLLSNTVHTRLGELLDVRLAPVAPQPEQVEPGDTGHVTAFRLTNAGNGQEAFALSAAISGFDAAVGSIRIDGDGDGDGRFDAAADAPAAGGASPLLAPGASIFVFVLSDIAPGVARGSNGSIVLTATSRTGSGTPGAAFPQAGDSGGDAVVGATTASASADVRLVVSDMGATLVKSQSVATPGGAAPGRGSIVTYTLEARFTAAVRDARVADPLPAGTTYRANSLRLDGTALSDPADGDAGAFDAGTRTISVALGDAAAAAVRTVSFQVQIN